MDTKALRQKILDLAIRGKLVPQDPNDEPAEVLLERIREQKQQMLKEGKLKKKDIKNDTIIFKGEDNLNIRNINTDLKIWNHPLDFLTAGKCLPHNPASCRNNQSGFFQNRNKFGRRNHAKFCTVETH